MNVKNYRIVSIWNKHKFKILVICSILMIAFLWYIDDDNPGTWSTEFHYVPTQITLGKSRGPRQSKGEKECRRVLESMFNAPFPSTRPYYMQNSVTGKPLELDCYNERLRIACEYNGKQHYEYVKAFHRNYDAFRTQQYRDKMKEELCKENGILLVVVPYWIQIEQIENYIRDKLVAQGCTI